ncbi:MAG: PQQ-binding-like beta-propeller repeat protein [Phycisphaerae bacterium]|jgi:outer membrane protein assembly factor BamB|nr:PQQ-binding-like beta-propeller repeat protein [Phycisphaerae bacterium]
MMRMTSKAFGPTVLSLICLVLFSAGDLLAGVTSTKILKSYGRESGVFVVIGCGDQYAPRVAVDLGRNGNSLVHALAGDAKELAAFNKAIAAGGVKGYVSAEQLPLSKLPYRDYMVNVVVVMNQAKAESAGLTTEEVRRCIAPFGRLVICSKGVVKKIEEIALPDEMDVWTHRYYSAAGIPASSDKVFNRPLGFKWNAGLPMNLNKRYASTRALLVNDGCCFALSTSVYENLRGGWRQTTGPVSYTTHLTCRDAFNGRMLWRKPLSGVYYGGLYIENVAPMVSVGPHVYVPDGKGKMIVVDSRTGKTLRQLPTAYSPGVISASDGIVVVTTWKGGKVIWGRGVRGRMDWNIAEGTTEAYDDKTGRRIWVNKLLGTSMVIAGGKVFIVSRSKMDELEKSDNKNKKFKHPPQTVVAIDLRKGKVLWTIKDEDIQRSNQALSLEAAGFGAVAVASSRQRNRVTLLSAETGRPLSGEKASAAGKQFFRYRGHICAPAMRVNGKVINRGKNMSFGGARAACLTGTIPAYGAGYIAQNWCSNCSPAQIAGLMAVASIGKVPSPAEMEAEVKPVSADEYDEKTDGAASASPWSSFRGNARRSSGSDCEIAKKVVVRWSKKVTLDPRSRSSRRSTGAQVGTVKRDWLSYLNTRLTAPVVSESTAIVGDVDRNEIIAVNLKTGRVVWRYMTGGRMDTAATLHKGICLVGDHTGYVHAVKINTGKLIYRLRIAPEEKRMVSYGKVESVWPVIGGVMVAEGKAYASAGRTQGSDGGLLVRAFVPGTGKQIWARALPAGGRGARRNDILIRQGDCARVMGQFLNLETGKKGSAKRGAGSLKMGNDGLYSWDWTRLGHRKFKEIGYGGYNGDTVSWTGDYIAACDKNNVLSFGSKGKAKKNFKLAADRQTTSLVVCKNLILMGGAILDEGSKKGFIQAISLTDAKPVWDQVFNSKLSFNGLAVADGNIVASFNDGSVAFLTNSRR